SGAHHDRGDRSADARFPRDGIRDLRLPIGDWRSAMGNRSRRGAQMLRRLFNLCRYHSDRCQFDAANSRVRRPGTICDHNQVRLVRSETELKLEAEKKMPKIEPAVREPPRSL